VSGDRGAVTESRGITSTRRPREKRQSPPRRGPQGPLSKQGQRSGQEYGSTISWVGAENIGRETTVAALGTVRRKRSLWSHLGLGEEGKKPKRNLNDGWFESTQKRSVNQTRALGGRDFYSQG